MQAIGGAPDWGKQRERERERERDRIFFLGGQTLVTKQTGEAGKPVNALLVAEKMKLVNEMYFAILLDRASAGPMVIACSEGGTSIEDPPGARQTNMGEVHLSYVRDPDGNKLCGLYRAG